MVILGLCMLDVGFPTGECVENPINCFSWAGGSPYFKQSSVEFSIEFRGLECFSYFKSTFGLGSIPFSIGLGCQMLCGLLFGFQKTETHSRARGGYHVSTYPSRGVTIVTEVYRIFFFSHPSIKSFIFVTYD